MKRKRYTEAQILAFLKEAEAGIPVRELVDLVADSSISGHYVCRVLDRAAPAAE
jgi:hypothetical protein